MMKQEKPGQSFADRQEPGKSSNKVGQSRRFPRIIGRKSEIQRLKDHLKDWGRNHFIYYWAAGGYGKTRLLEELQHLVEEAGPGYYSGGIIDLYHTATHASSDVEKLIIENLLRELDPNREKYFTNYLRERELYENIREQGADPGELEKKRASLSQIFINDFHALALQVRKLVICFDTIEIIQYESTAIEEMIGMDEVDPRIRGWMLEKLPKLANVLIVFAGRPKEGPFQERLISDMHKSFGSALEVVALPPFNAQEMDEFFHALPDGEKVCPANYKELIYMLTGGRPILLHLVYDLLNVLATAPQEIFDMFDNYRPLVEKYRGVPVEKLGAIDEVKTARSETERNIITLMINRENGAYLQKLVLLQKGIDSEIIEKVMGLSADETEDLIQSMKQLSFIKQHIPDTVSVTDRARHLPHTVQTQEERIFFHDEMTRLMTDPLYFRNIRIEERQSASTINASFYDPHIRRLEERIRAMEGAQNQQARISLRDELYKMLTERLYYLLLRDPQDGYAEYKRLSARACAERKPGFSMRVRDEFLRFYNPLQRRKQFISRGISHEQVVRDSAQLWMERLHWNGNYDKAVDFGRKVLDNPGQFFIRAEDVDILGNVCALWARAYAMKFGFDEAVMAKTQEVLRSMPALDQCSENALLACGRLATSVGYLARWAGLFDLATDANSLALSSFRMLETYQEEQAIVLNNMATVYAKRGQVVLASSFGKEAIKINKKIASRYTLGLTYTNLATVERLARTNYTRAVDYAKLALELFLEIEDFHGLVRAYLNLGSAWRGIAVEEFWDQSPESAVKHLEIAKEYILKGLETARNGQLTSEIPGLKAELGKIYRGLGQVFQQLGDHDLSVENLHEAERLFEEALKWDGWSKMDRADIEEDVATSIFQSGDRAATRAQLERVKQTLGTDKGEPGDDGAELPAWYYLPLGKVELLYGYIAMAENKPVDGLYYFASAYAFFTRFSDTAVEKNLMLDHVFRRYLSEKPFSEISQLMTALDQRLLEQNCKIHDVNVTPFVENLKKLTGIS